MHIRLLMITFFLQFFPDLIRRGHLLHPRHSALPRPQQETHDLLLFRPREAGGRGRARSAGHEITRFKGLGEISAGEFKDFIGENIRLEPVNLHHLFSSEELLSFYMGKNTPDRQDFIIDHLRMEKGLVEA